MININKFTRYQKNILINQIDLKGQKRLLESKVLIVGCGGLGHPVIQYLTGAGVGNITLCDDDYVQLTNLNRQILFAMSDIDKSKVALAKSYINKHNQDISVSVIDQRITSINCSELIVSHDLIIDCSDNLNTKFLLNDICIRENKPLIHAAVSGSDGRIMVIEQNGPCLRCVFDDIPPEGAIPSCQDSGVLGASCGVVGSYMALIAIYLLVKNKIKQNDKLILFQFDLPILVTEMKIEKNEECSSCSPKEEVRG